MDPVTVGAVVLAIVSGAAGEAAGRLWDGLRNLVRRLPVSPSNNSESKTVPNALTELVALEKSPAEGRAVDLAKALLARGEVDPTFRRELETWWTQARQIQIDRSNVISAITGGTQYGPVLQGRDFTSLTFNSNPPPQRPEE